MNGDVHCEDMVKRLWRISSIGYFANLWELVVNLCHGSIQRLWGIDVTGCWLACYAARSRTLIQTVWRKKSVATCVMSLGGISQHHAVEGTEREVLTARIDELSRAFKDAARNTEASRIYNTERKNRRANASKLRVGDHVAVWASDAS